MDHFNDQQALPTPFLPNPPSKPAVPDELQSLRVSLKWCALDHSSFTGKFVSYAAFLLLGLVVPTAVSFLVKPRPFHDGLVHKVVQLPESMLAGIAFVTITGFFRQYGLRQLLFLDGLREDSGYVRRGYSKELDKALKYLTYILLPSFSIEVSHKIIFFSKMTIKLPLLPSQFPRKALIFLASMSSWLYRTGVFLILCIMFRLTCELQILRLEGFKRMLEECRSDAGGMFVEHIRIRRQLLITSHRYRMFILGCLVTISVSQLGALMLVLSSSLYQKNFSNSGDLVVCSVVQLSGFFICLTGAARITHRAQRMVSIATKWHLTMTCMSNSGSENHSNQDSTQNTTDDDELSLLVAADLDSINKPDNSQLHIESRKALLLYLQHNNGGITLFGFAIDRGLLHTLFAFEMSLVLWILSKVVVVT